MSYEFYKWLHLTGAFIVLSGLITYITLRRFKLDTEAKWKKIAVICHGAGLAIVLVGGFGLAARLGYMQGLPSWIYIKLIIWFILGAMWSAVKRKEAFGVFYILVLVLFSAATLTASMKPGM